MSEDLGKSGLEGEDFVAPETGGVEVDGSYLEEDEKFLIKINDLCLNGDKEQARQIIEAAKSYLESKADATPDDQTRLKSTLESAQHIYETNQVSKA